MSALPTSVPAALITSTVTPLAPRSLLPWRRSWSASIQTRPLTEPARRTGVASLPWLSDWREACSPPPETVAVLTVVHWPLASGEAQAAAATFTTSVIAGAL